MKYVKSIFALIFMLIYPSNAFAQDQVPEAAAEKIPWVINLCGEMPPLLVWSLIAIAVMTVVTIAAAKIKEGRNDE